MSFIMPGEKEHTSRIFPGVWCADTLREKRVLYRYDLKEWLNMYLGGKVNGNIDGF